MAEKARLSSVTGWTIAVYCLIFCVVGSVILICLIFSKESDPDAWAHVVAFFLGSALICGLIKGFRKAFDWIQDKKSLGIVAKTSAEMMYGLGGAVIATIVPRIAIFFCAENGKLFLLILGLSLVTVFFFHRFFIYGYNRYCDYEACNDIPAPVSILFIFQIATVFMAGRAAVKYHRSELHWIAIMLCQLGMLVLSTSASIEYCMVWNGNVTWREKSKRDESKSEIPGSFTETIFCLCQHVAFLFFILLVCMKLNDTVTWQTIGIMMGTLASVCLFFVSLHTALRWFMEKMKCAVLTQYKLESCIGLVLMTVCAVVPRVMVYFWAMDLQVLLSSLVISLCTALLAGGIFVRGSSRDWKLKYSCHWKSILVVAIIHFLTLVATIRISLEYNYSKEIETILYVQLGCMFVSFPAMADLGLIVMGGMKPKPKGRATEMKTVKTVDRSVDEPRSQYQSHECKICCLEHNNTLRVPRVLQCGHTICEPCADTLLQKTKDHLKCPFCQNITIVEGLSKLLPKNYGMLEVIEEHKTQEVA